MSVSLNLEQIELYLKSYLLLFFACYYSLLIIIIIFFPKKISKINKETVLCRFCYVLLHLNESKLFSKYSTISSFTIAAMLLHAKIISSTSNMKDFVYKFSIQV